MVPGTYSFKQFEKTDLQYVEPWLQTPEVISWYPDPEYIEDLEDHLDDDRVRMQIILHESEAFAYIHDYDIHGWADHHLSFLPKGSRGLDTFIGNPDMIGCGHGSAYIDLLVRELFSSGVPALGIDPHPNNGKAIRAYEKAGFQKIKQVSNKWGPNLLMSIHR